MGKVVADVSSFTIKLVVDVSSSTSKLVVGVSPSIIVPFVGNLTMGVIFFGAVLSSFTIIPSPSKLVAHYHILHDKRLVQVDQYPSKEGFLDDDALNEHFDAWNAHHQRL
jgi:hypothetical protein